MSAKPSPCTRVVFEYPFKAVMNFTAPIKLSISPFDSGSWEFFATSSFHSSDTIAYGIKWCNVERSAPLVMLRLRELCRGVVLAHGTHYLLDLQSSPFPMHPTGKKEWRLSEVAEGVTVELEIVARGSPPERTFDGAASSAALSYGAFLDSAHPNNLRLVFPRERRELWSNDDLLRSRSTYFRDLLGSGFTEGSLRTKPMPLEGDQKPSTSAFDDSDDEGDRAGAPVAKEQTGGTCNTPFYEIVISADSSYHTYRAVLFWLSTGVISFAPLRSLVVAQVEEAHTMRSDPHQLKPVSPKSVYRLADLLDLPALRQVALQNFKTSLTAKNVLAELFSDVAAVYPEIADAAVEAAASLWDEVKEEKGAMGEVESRIRAGANDLPVAVMWKPMTLL